MFLQETYNIVSFKRERWNLGDASLAFNFGGEENVCGRDCEGALGQVWSQRLHKVRFQALKVLWYNRLWCCPIFTRHLSLSHGVRSLFPPTTLHITQNHPSPVLSGFTQVAISSELYLLLLRSCRREGKAVGYCTC